MFTKNPCSTFFSEVTETFYSVIIIMIIIIFMLLLWDPWET